MEDNPVIDRIRKVRLSISKKFDHDPRKVIEHYIDLERKRKSEIIDLNERYKKKVTVIST